MCCKSAAGIVGAAVEVAVSAVAEDEGAAALGTDAGGYLGVCFALGGIDVANVGSVVHLIPDVLLREAGHDTAKVGIRKARIGVALDGGQQLVIVDDMVLGGDVLQDSTASKHDDGHDLQVGPGA